jgi:hypothetical protein
MKRIVTKSEIYKKRRGWNWKRILIL